MEIMSSSFVKVVLAVVLSFCMTVPALLQAAPQVVTMNVREKSVKDAIDAAIRIAAVRNINVKRRFLLSLIEAEALPISNQFVSSYKINRDRRRAGSVHITAQVEMESLRTLASFNAFSNEFTNQKALILIASPDQGMPWLDKPRHEKDGVLVDMIERNMRSRLARRGFAVQPKLESYTDALATLSTNILSRDFLSPAARKLGVGLIAVVKADFILKKNKRGYNVRYLRLQSRLYNDSKNEVYRTNAQLITMNAHRNAYQNGRADELLQNTINQHFYQLFLQAGNSYLQFEDDRLVLRVLHSAGLRGLNSVREAVEEIQQVNSVIEKRITPDAHEYGVDTSLSVSVLRRKIMALDTQASGIKIKSLNAVDSKLLELEFAMLESEKDSIQQEARKPNGTQGSVY